MHYGILAIIIAATGYMIHSWVGGHAIAVMTPKGEWQLDAIGWAGVWPPLMAGLVPGLLLGLFAGSRLGDLVKALFFKTAQAEHLKLVEERQKIEAMKAKLDGELKKAALEGRREGAAMAQEASRARFEAEDKARAMERRLKAQEGRMKGAQQKAARMQKKAQLMGRHAAKPA